MNQDNQSDRYVDFMKNSFCFFTMTSGCICISLLAEQTPNKAQGLRDSVDAFARHRPAEYIEKPRRRRSQVHAVSTEPFRDKPRQSLKSLVCLDNSWGETVRCPRTPETQAQQNAPRAWPRAWGHKSARNDGTIQSCRASTREEKDAHMADSACVMTTSDDRR